MTDSAPVCPVDDCSRAMDVERVPWPGAGTFGGKRITKPDRVYYTCPVHGPQKRPW